ncbi:dihydrodipicolinate synthase family protein [Rhodococcus sp. NPDC056960]|uniref:dihydrodipicolinate synthase family protein n=1 Tax=Rhodococcus sp. NPDC056960 TaxID=3345982 RepID=UPI00364533DB
MPESTVARFGGLRGVFPALVTPFSEDAREIDEKALRTVVDHAVSGGVNGFVVCGGSGEFNSLTIEERRRAVEIVTEQSAGKVTVVAQTGAMTTTEAIEHSEHAAAAGAGALMVGLPYYEPLNIDQVIEYFSAIAAVVDLPLMAYNYPYATGFNFTPELTAELVSAVPSVEYVKDSAGDLGQVHGIATSLDGKVGVFSGSDSHTAPALLMGAVGVVNGASQVFPREFATMYAAAADGNHSALIDEWSRLLPFFTFAEGNHYASAIKHALRIVGVPVGSTVRRPAQDLSASSLAELEGILAKLA